MKILLYAEPTIIQILPQPLSSLYKYHLYHWLAESLLKNKDVEIKTIVPEIAYLQNLKYHHIDELSPISFNEDYIQEIFSEALSLKEIYLKIFNNQLSTNEHISFQEKIYNILPKNWKPDIVLDYPIHNPLLQKAFPNALHLLVENGLFSRPPFDNLRTLRFEPIHFLNGFLNKFKLEINNFKITKKQKDILTEFKKKLRQIIEQNNPKREILKKLKTQYKYLILCPIPTDNIYNETKYNDQYFYLLNLLKKIPKDIGVIITFHDNVISELRLELINTLKDKYPNLIHFKVENNIHTSQSLNYFEYCDAIVNMHTMTGTLSLLWDLKVISLDKNYSHSFCDKRGLDNIAEFLAQPKQDKSAFLYWYLTHFMVYQKNFNTDNWYYNYFKTKLDKYKKGGIKFDFYEQLEDIESLADYICQQVSSYYTNLNNTI